MEQRTNTYAKIQKELTQKGVGLDKLKKSRKFAHYSNYPLFIVHY